MISNDMVKKNVAAIRSWMNEEKIDSFYVSSFDPYLNEYVPLENCHRYYVTGFTGSTASVMITPKNIYLYVDGRYHEQVDKEVDLSFVTPVKTPMGKSNDGLMLEMIRAEGIKSIALEPERVSRKIEESFETEIKTVSYDLSDIIEFLPTGPLKEVKHLPRSERGEDTLEKLPRILKEGQGIFISALDSIAWLSNCRGFHLPFQSTFLSRGFSTENKFYIFVDQNCPLAESTSKIEGVEFIKISAVDMVIKLQEIKKNNKMEEVFYDPKSVNAFDFRMLRDIFGEKLKERAGGTIPVQAVKTASEIDVMKKAFVRSNKAIWNAICETKKNIKDGKKMSELDFYNLANISYKKEGAIDNSFNTIAAVGANASIMHYADSSADVEVTPGEFVLFDSGALYESGFSTDTTRTFVCGGTPSSKQKEIYTLVLKGLLQVENSVFPTGTTGASIDMLARQSMFKFGHNYMHGTGHGVGINVHEGGAGISSNYNRPLLEGNVVSIEPGIYLPGFGGVRLENVALVKKHPKFEDYLYFETMVKIPYEEALINRDLLDSEEIKWLEEYHSIC